MASSKSGTEQHQRPQQISNENVSSKVKRQDPMAGLARLVPSSGSAQEQALLQQALHQQALHQQSLQQHGIHQFRHNSKPTSSPLPPRQGSSNLPSPARQSQQPQMHRGHVVKAEPMDLPATVDSKGPCLEAKNAAEQAICDEKEPEEGSGRMFADLNVEPPNSDGEEPTTSSANRLPADEKRKKKKLHSEQSLTEEDNKKLVRPAKPRAKVKGEESGVEGDFEYPGNVQNVKEEKIKSLKAGLIHVARKLPKNAHAHFVLGLMHQRSQQPLKAIAAFERAEEILKHTVDAMCQGRAQLLAVVQNHHAQCVLQGNLSTQVGKDMSKDDINGIVNKMKEATIAGDSSQAAIWNVLGLLLMQTGRLQNAISVFTSLLSVVPDYMDALANLGVAYLQKGDLDKAARCIQSVLEKDVYHPGALVNYGTILLRQHGAFLPGAGAGAGEGGYLLQSKGAIAACHIFQTVLKEEPKAAHAWVNLAAAYEVSGDYSSSSKCLEQASKLEPNRLSTRYAIAAHRIKDAERSDDPLKQMDWAANEMASILREGENATLQPRLAWAGLAMVNRAQHESAASFDRGTLDLKEAEERAVHTLQQAVEEDPEDALKWHQLGLHTLCTLQFAAAQNYLKSAIARRQTFAMAWSNLGIALQLSEDSSSAEAVYKQAISLMAPQQSHSLYSNLGNLYRQQKRFTEAHAAYKKALEVCPNYAPACNNLGLLYVAEGRWDEALTSFDEAFKADPYLDIAKSNKIKAMALSQLEKTRL